MNIIEAIRRSPWLFLAVIICLALHVYAIRHDSITADEQDHLIYGVAVLKGEPGRRNVERDFVSTMPVTAFNALPRAFEQLLHPGLRKTDDGKADIRSGRYITVVFSILLLIYIYMLAQSLAGPGAAGVIVCLAASEPNLLAHGHLVTTDLYSALGFTASVYHFYRWRFSGSNLHFVAWCAALAFAQVAKYNNILLYPAFGLLLLIAARRPEHINVRNSLYHLLIFLLLQWLIINSAFGFSEVFFRPADTSFSSPTIARFMQLWPGDIPFPLALPYVDGFDMIRYELLHPDINPSNYLLGQVRRGMGFPHYYLVVWHLKTPLILILLCYASGWYWLRKSDLRRQLLLFLLPCLFLFLLISTSSIQGGYRYLLPITAVMLACTAPLINTMLKSRRYLIWSAVGLIFLETITWAPNFIPYSNQLIPVKKNAYQLMADSNLDWRQREDLLKQWLREHPDVQFEPMKPVKGKLLVGINNLTGIYDEKTYDWLRHYEPTRHLWHCYLLYEIP